MSEMQQKDSIPQELDGRSFAPQESAIWLLFLTTVPVALGVWLRFILVQEPLWIDELHTSWTVSGDFRQLVDRAAIGNQSPLYFLLVKPFADIWQLSQPALGLRLLSMVSGLLTILFSGWLVFRHTRSALAGCMTVVLFALHYDFVYYSSEARSYALAQCVFIVHLFALLACYQRLVSNRDRETMRLSDWVWLICLAVTAILLFYLHYATILVIGCEFVLVLLAVVRNVGDRKRQLIIAATVLVVGLAILPELIQALAIQGRGYDWAIAQDLMAYTRQNSWQAIFLCALPLGLSILDGVRSNKNHHGSAEGRDQPLVPALVLGCLAILPVALVCALASIQFVSLAHPRFTILSSTAMVILSGFLIARIRARTLLIVACLFVTGWVVVNNPIFMNRIYNRAAFQSRNEPWQETVALINATTSTDRRPIFLFPNLVEDSYFARHMDDPEFNEYYLFPFNGVHEVVEQDQIYLAGRPLEGDLFTELDFANMIEFGGARLIVRGDEATCQLLIDAVVNVLGSQVTCEIKPIMIQGNVLMVDVNYSFLDFELN